MRLKGLLIVLTVLLLTACQSGNNDMNRDNAVGDTENIRDGQGTTDEFTQNVRNRTGDDKNRGSNRSEDQFDVSEEAAERIVEEVAEIDRAYVLTTNRNAYVAATLNEDHDRSSKNNPTKDTDRKGQNQNLEMDFDQDITRDRQTSERANRRDTQNEVRDTEKNADNVTDEVKREIAKIVQDVDSEIDNVYVTTSPDFFNLTDEYIRDFEDGRPIQGMFDQIGNMIERVFPQNKR